MRPNDTTETETIEPTAIPERRELTQEDYYKIIESVFSTNDGKLLLNIWEQSFLYKKIALEGDDLLTIGIRQGEAQFVLSIIQLLQSRGA